MNDRLARSCAGTVSARSTVIGSREQAGEVELGSLRGVCEALGDGGITQAVFGAEVSFDAPPEVRARAIELARHRRLVLAGDPPDLSQGEILAVIQPQAQAVPCIQCGDRSIERVLRDGDRVRPAWVRRRRVPRYTPSDGAFVVGVRLFRAGGGAARVDVTLHQHRADPGDETAASVIPGEQRGTLLAG